MSILRVLPYAILSIAAAACATGQQPVGDQGIQQWKAAIATINPDLKPLQYPLKEWNVASMRYILPGGGETTIRESACDSMFANITPLPEQAAWLKLRNVSFVEFGPGCLFGQRRNVCEHAITGGFPDCGFAAAGKNISH